MKYRRDDVSFQKHFGTGRKYAAVSYSERQSMT